MCGIAGIIFNNNLIFNNKLYDLFHTREGKNYRERILQILALGIKERGPFFQATNSMPHAQFLHSRIPTQSDEIIGRQPMILHDFESDNDPFRDVMITYNGDIYADGRKTLESIVGKQADASDTALLIAGYKAVGKYVLNVLGTTNEYAFVVCDEYNNRFLAARDNSGNRPLFYVIDTQTQNFIFSSLAFPLAELIKQKEITGTIEQLLPGEILEGDFINYRKSFFQPDYYGLDTSLAPPDFLEAFYYLIEKAIEKRIPEMPFAIKVSGGLDSIAALHIARKILTEQGRNPNDAVPINFGFAAAEDPIWAERYFHEFGITNAITIRPTHKKDFLDQLFRKLPEIAVTLESTFPNLIRFGALSDIIAKSA